MSGPHNPSTDRTRSWAVKGRPYIPQVLTEPLKASPKGFVAFNHAVAFTQSRQRWPRVYHPTTTLNRRFRLQLAPQVSQQRCSGGFGGAFWPFIRPLP